MPNRNGTGPSGMGPMTGRGAGSCAGRGQRSGQSYNNSDLLMKGIGTLALALGSVIFRALARKLKSSPEKDAKTKGEEKLVN